MRFLNTFAIFLVRLYQIGISPYLGNRCRFHPSCSAYTIESLRKFPFLKGLWYSATRILKCHPFSKGGYDPVKEIKNDGF